jgi:hypothetical protein
MRHVGKLTLIMAAAAVTVATVGGVAIAAHSSGKIEACAAKSDGALRLAKSCDSNEKKVTWNVTGPRGAPGQPGAPGPPGADGSSGVSNVDYALHGCTNNAGRHPVVLQRPVPERWRDRYWRWRRLPGQLRRSSRGQWIAAKHVDRCGPHCWYVADGVDRLRRQPGWWHQHLVLRVRRLHRFNVDRHYGGAHRPQPVGRGPEVVHGYASRF